MPIDTEIWRGMLFEECRPYGPRRHHYGPGCYAPCARPFCSTVHVRLWVNAPPGTVPPAGAPTYDGNADWRIQERRRLLIVPGAAMLGSAGIGTSGKTTYALIVDDATGQPMAWFEVTDWSFTTAVIGPTTEAIDWIALEVKHA